MAMGVFEYIGTTVESAMSAFVTSGIGNVIGVITATATAGVTLYFVLMGYMIIAGRIQAPFEEFVLKCVKIAIVAFFALNAGNYSGYVMGGIKSIESGLSSAMPSVGAAPPANVYQTVDRVLEKGMEQAAKCLGPKADEASIGPMFGWILAGGIIAVGTVILVLVGGVMVLLAKLMLAVLFVLGPFFIMLLMFPATARYFDSWAGQAMSYTMTIVICSAVLSLGMVCFDHQITSLGIDSMSADDASPIAMACEVAILTAAFSYLTYQAGGLAGALAGGMGMAAVTFGQMANPFKRAAQNLLDNFRKQHTSYRQNIGKDGQLSGPQVQGSRLGHLLSGRSMASPAYRRAAIDRLKQNWGMPTGTAEKAR
ncbi:MAG: type IV secretion system protein [Azoarcus sp.]|jgi:type IV secretion system protein VirB6|nr:type IV secretion system protein [Azoarcus sp.]